KAAKEFPRRYPEIVALDAVNFEECRDFLTRVRKSRGPTFQSKRPLARESISDRTWGVIFFFLLMLFLVLAFVFGPHESHRQRHTYPYRGGYAPVPNAIGERIRIERIMRERIQRIMH